MHITCRRAATLLSAAAFAAGAFPAFAQSVEEEVTAAYAAWNEDFNAGDAAALAENYTQDALFLPATHDVIDGTDGVAEFFQGLFDMGVTAHELELIRAEEAGDTIVAAARWSAAGKDEAGTDQPWSGISTHVFERGEGGDLKLRLHTFN